MDHRGLKTLLLSKSIFVCVAASIVVGGATAAVVTAPGVNGQIAFRRYLDDGRTWGAVFVSSPDGMKQRQVTRPPRGVNDDQPDWSPDGSLLVFFRCPGICQVHTCSGRRERFEAANQPDGKRRLPRELHAGWEADRLHKSVGQASNCPGG